MEERATDKLLAAIEKSKYNGLDQLITGLGIKNVGRQTARVLAMNFADIHEIANASLEQLINLSNFGLTITSSVLNYFADEKNQQLITKLKNANVNLKSNVLENDEMDDRFSGKTFVITGTLPT